MSKTISLEQLNQAYQEISNHVVSLEVERSRLRDNLESLQNATKTAEDNYISKDREFRANSGAATQLHMLIRSLESQETEVKEEKIDSSLRRSAEAAIGDKLNDEEAANLSKVLGGVEERKAIDSDMNDRPL